MTIEPYSISIPQADLDLLRSRLRNNRWPGALEGAGWERGVPVPYLRDLVAYWADTYDWRREEARLNARNQFMTTIDGQPIHFFHVRSPEADALPLLLLHGWPSSSVEYLGIIDRLVNPDSAGEDGPAFHLVIPTIPGFGLSAPVREAGWQSVQTAKAYRELMARLGYTRYGGHGSDIGADILGVLGTLDPGRLVGAHLATDTSTLVVSIGMFMGGSPPADIRSCPRPSGNGSGRSWPTGRRRRGTSHSSRHDRRRSATVFRTLPSPSWPGRSRSSVPGPNRPASSPSGRSTSTRC